MSKTILLAEDEPHIVTAVSYLLKRAGFQTLTATDGQQALDMALAESPDVLVLDLMMPKLDGYEVLRRLRADPQGEKLPVLMLTAKSQGIDREKAFECGADRYMTKPFANAELVAMVEELAGKS